MHNPPFPEELGSCHSTESQLSTLTRSPVVGVEGGENPSANPNEEEFGVQLLRYKRKLKRLLFSLIATAATAAIAGVVSLIDRRK